MPLHLSYLQLESQNLHAVLGLDGQTDEIVFIMKLMLRERRTIQYSGERALPKIGQFFARVSILGRR